MRRQTKQDLQELGVLVLFVVGMGAGAFVLDWIFNLLFRLFH